MKRSQPMKRTYPARRTGEDLTCPICGKVFYARRSEIVSKNRRFCSVECRGKGMPAPSSSPTARRKIAEAKRGPGNAMWRGEDTRGSVYRVFNVKLKGEECCRNCGRSDMALHLHHIVPRSMCKAGIRDLRNGVTLCAKCHHGWHHRLIVVHRDIFSEDEWAFVSSLELLGQNLAAWLDDRYPSVEAYRRITNERLAA